MAEFRFYGSLKQFGTTFQLDVRDTAEGLRALTTQIPKVRQFIQQGWFKIRIGRDYMDSRYLEKGLGYRLPEKAVVHITPVLKGAKRAGVFQVVLGAALIGAAFFTGGLTLALVGGAMMLGGVAQMLTKTPKTKSDSADKKQSTAFGNAQNMAAQGNPIPLAYGRIMAGSLIISQGIENFNAEI
jgi:predicted phage tail protein